MKPPNSEQRKVPSTARPALELEPGHPTFALSGGINSSIPRQPTRGEVASWQQDGRVTFPPSPACPPAPGLQATYSRFAKEVPCFYLDLHRPTPARDQRGEAISSGAATIGRGKPGAQTPAQNAVRWRGPRGVRTAPASRQPMVTAV